MTLGELFETFLVLYSKPNKKTWVDDVAMFNFHLHGWRLRKISRITKMDVIKLHKHIGETRGRTIANRVIELLCAMLNRAIRDWGWTGTNPAANLKAFREQKRSRFLDGRELPAFFKALTEAPNTTVRDFFLVALLTGARRSNVEAMRWSEINLPRGTWAVSPENSCERSQRTSSARASVWCWISTR